jgi:hypothetical protein
MRNEYERAPTREQMEDIMGNRMNVMNGRSEVEYRGDNDVEKRQTIKEARKRAISKQTRKQSE